MYPQEGEEQDQNTLRGTGTRWPMAPTATAAAAAAGPGSGQALSTVNTLGPSCGE